MKYGYARISDKSQNLDVQIDELNEYGVDEIVQEVVTGVSPKKDQLDELVERIKPGDELIVVRHDRLGRSTLQLLTLIEELEKKNVRFKMLSLPELDTKGPFGKPMIAIFSAFAEMERSALKEKQKKGIEAARRRGKHLGRKANGYTKAGMENAINRYLKGESVNIVCDEYNIPRSSFYAKIKEAGIKR